jgi:hypothetical protein
VTVGDDFKLPQRVIDTLPAAQANGVEYTRVTPASVWNLQHTLQRRPVVKIYDASGVEVEADVEADSTSVTITFPSPYAGSVVLT